MSETKSYQNQTFLSLIVRKLNTVLPSRFVRSHFLKQESSQSIHSLPSHEVQGEIADLENPILEVANDISGDPFLPYRQRSPEARDAVLCLVLDHIDPHLTDTLPIEKRRSGEYYRENEINEVLAKIREGQKSVVVEGEVAAGKTSFIIEIEDMISQEGIPHSFLIADNLSQNPERLERFTQSLEKYLQLTTQPLIVIIENGSDLAREFSEGRVYYFADIKEKIEKGERLSQQESNALRYYQQLSKLLIVLSQPQFRLITTSYKNYFEHDIGSTDATLVAQLRTVFNLDNIYPLIDKPDVEKCVTMMVDHLEVAYSQRTGKSDGQFLDLESNRPYLQAIAESPYFSFKHFKTTFDLESEHQ